MIWMVSNFFLNRISLKFHPNIFSFFIFTLQYDCELALYSTMDGGVHRGGPSSFYNHHPSPSSAGLSLPGGGRTAMQSHPPPSQHYSQQQQSPPTSFTHSSSTDNHYGSGGGGGPLGGGGGGSLPGYTTLTPGTVDGVGMSPLGGATSAESQLKRDRDSVYG